MGAIRGGLWVQSVVGLVKLAENTSLEWGVLVGWHEYGVGDVVAHG